MARKPKKKRGGTRPPKKRAVALSKRKRFPKRVPAPVKRPAIKRVRRKALAPIRSTVAGWVRKLDPDERPRRFALLADSLKLVRQFYSGFEARDGFKLNELKRLSVSQINSIARRAQYLRELKSRPAIAIRPRTPKTKQILGQHTGQGLIKNQKKYLYHTDTPQKTQVRVRGKKVETLRKFLGIDGKVHTAVYRNYYFPFSRRVRTWEALLDVAEAMIKRLPEGRYRIVSSLHSDIYAPTPKSKLLEQLQRWFDQYGDVTGKEGFASGIIGFRWVGLDFKQSDLKLRQSDQIRENFRKSEEKRKRRERALVRKRLNKRR